jgi:hypothetical protein
MSLGTLYTVLLSQEWNTVPTEQTCVMLGANCTCMRLSKTSNMTVIFCHSLDAGTEETCHSTCAVRNQCCEICTLFVIILENQFTCACHSWYLTRNIVWNVDFMCFTKTAAKGQCFYCHRRDVRLLKESLLIACSYCVILVKSVRTLS